MELLAAPWTLVHGWFTVQTLVKQGAAGMKYGSLQVNMLYDELVQWCMSGGDSICVSNRLLTRLVLLICIIAGGLDLRQAVYVAP